MKSDNRAIVGYVQSAISSKTACDVQRAMINNYCREKGVECSRFFCDVDHFENRHKSSVEKAKKIGIRSDRWLGLPKKGSNYTSDDGKAKYKITKSDAKKGTVTFVAPANKKATTITIPSTVKIKGITFKVTAIEKNAFKNNKKIKSVTIGKNVTTIGSKAFYGCSKLKTLKIKTTKLATKKIGSKAFSKTPKSMKVTVPKKKFKAYKSMLIKKGVNKKAKFVKG